VFACGWWLLKCGGLDSLSRLGSGHRVI